MPGVPVRFRQAFHRLRTEGAGVVRETLAIALGVFIGCLPLYGFHLVMCWSIGFALGLNRVKMYLASNISNPLVAPWLVLAEIQAGSWLRHGAFHPLTLEAIKTTAVSRVGMDLLIGSLVVGATLASIAAIATYAAVRGRSDDVDFAALVGRAADRYTGASITAWAFARGKLAGDPVYRAALTEGVLVSGGTLLDVGCGQGLTLALLAEAKQAVDAGSWPADTPPPPQFTRLAGIETRGRVAAIAREALEGDAEIIEADARAVSIERATAVLMFDVLQLMCPEEQDALLAETADRLEPGGVVLVREADASAGWRFSAVRLGNRLKAIALWTRHQPFHARTRAEWRECFARRGFRTEERPMDRGTPFANVLFRLTAEPSASASANLSSPPV